MTREEAIKVLSEFPMYDNAFKFKEACETAIKIMQAPESRGWIMCKDRMPENSEWDNIVVTSGGRTEIVTNYYNGFNCRKDNRQCEITGIIAWFPLPEPLEGGDE